MAGTEPAKSLFSWGEEWGPFRIHGPTAETLRQHPSVPAASAKAPGHTCEDKDITRTHALQGPCAVATRSSPRSCLGPEPGVSNAAGKGRKRLGIGEAPTYSGLQVELGHRWGRQEPTMGQPQPLWLSQTLCSGCPVNSPWQGFTPKQAEHNGDTPALVTPPSEVRPWYGSETQSLPRPTECPLKASAPAPMTPFFSRMSLSEFTPRSHLFSPPSVSYKQGGPNPTWALQHRSAQPAVMTNPVPRAGVAQLTLPHGQERSRLQDTGLCLSKLCPAWPQWPQSAGHVHTTPGSAGPLPEPTPPSPVLGYLETWLLVF